jgi:predicted amidophosphoribosyltransferase
MENDPERTPPGRPPGRLRAALGLSARFGGKAILRALELVYPGFCRECGVPVEGGPPFCPRCAASIRWIASACARCGQPLPAPADSCGGCVSLLLPFDHAACAAEYAGSWRTAVLRFKYAGDQGVRDWLSGALERVYRERFAALSPQTVVPVPPHPWRRLLRGRDPVEDLARELGARAGLPVRNVLTRCRSIASQTSLPREERLKNPRGAYAVRARFRPRGGRPSPHLAGPVLLLDDVYTTGATAAECARALKDAGARRVLVLAAARSND